MLCTQCQQREATIHLIQFRAGSARELHLCASCAAQRGLHSSPPQGASRKKDLPAPQKKHTDLPPLLPGGGRPLLTQTAEAPAIVSLSGKEAKDRCPNCGMSSKRLQKQQIAGCAYCYDFFAEKLNKRWGVGPPELSSKAQSSLKRMAGLSQVLQDERSRRRHEAYLRELLHHHLARERYEKAAIIRDQLRHLHDQGL